MRIRVLVCAALLYSAAADARMYQWVNPATGTTRFSGDPPSWYRSGRVGPRVLVFDGGTLIDDTSLSLPLDRVEALREAAFQEASKRRDLQLLKRLEETGQREAAEAEKRASKSAPEPEEATTADGEETAKRSDLISATIEQWKAIIDEFDRLGGAAVSGGDSPPAPR